MAGVRASLLPDEVSKVHADGFGDEDEVAVAGIAGAAFDALECPSIDTGHLREIFLREECLIA